MSKILVSENILKEINAVIEVGRVKIITSERTEINQLNKLTESVSNKCCYSNSARNY